MRTVRLVLAFLLTPLLAALVFSFGPLLVETEMAGMSQNLLN
jgi:hypothetical protein